jgi:AbrB family looped-hinge helix DNA binding protein
MVVARAKVTSKGQITIPAEVRRELGVGPGDRVAFVCENGRIRVERAKSWVEETAGIFKDAAIHPPPSAEALRRMAADAIAEEVAERMRRSG